MRIAGTRALLTGATGGLGTAIARALAERGATLVLSSRKGEELERLTASLPGAGHEAVVADLAADAAGERLAADATAGGPVDVFVANAGLPGSGRLEDLSAEEVTRVLRVNLEAPVRATRALLPPMLERGAGHFVYISSLSGKVPSPRSAMYSGTKFGLRGFTLALRQDLRGSGVGASLVAPGFVSDAGMFADAGIEAPAEMGTSTSAEVGDAVARAIERNRAEILVAPVRGRLAAGFGSHFPGAAAIAQRGRGERLAEKLARNQLDKR